MKSATAPGVLALALTLSGCVYYNAMWSAERAAGQARRAEANGSEGEARGHWMRAAVKAESVHVRHPGSRWADDAWVLHAEGLVRAGSCANARRTIGAALVEVTDPPLRERVALLAAECALALGSPVEATRQLEPVLASSDRERRSRAEYLAGRVAEAQGDLAGAAARYARSREHAAARARVRVLLALDRREAALASAPDVLRRRFVETEWAALLDAVAQGAGPAAASAALDRALSRTRVAPDARARLLISDGDRRFAAGQYVAAAERYASARRVAPDNAQAQTAEVRRWRALAAQATDRADLEPVRDGLASLRAGGRRLAPDAAALDVLLDRVLSPAPSVVAGFRAAELARDSLRAMPLAGRLFADLAARYPESLFAPKALVAARALLPDRYDSLTAALATTYPDSPYLRAARGELSPGYTALEDSLARALGVAAAPTAVLAGSRVRAPTAGPRGPWWEEVFAPVAIAAPDTATVDDDDEVMRRRQQRRQGERPRAEPRSVRPDP